LQNLPEAQQGTFSAVTSFVRSLGDVEVTFLSFDRNHDKAYIAQFSGARKLVVWDPEVMAIADFLAMFASHDAVITARAHGAILGAVMGVVPICLGISQKLKEVSKFFPKGGLLVDNFADSNALMQAWTEVACHHSHFLTRLRDDVETNKVVAGEAMKKLLAIA
jgi:polysaccharide pyruvyl transferase WcaK-like protein